MKYLKDIGQSQVKLDYAREIVSLLWPASLFFPALFISSVLLYPFSSPEKEWHFDDR